MASDVATIETGLSCNNRCPYCPQQILRSCRPHAALSTDEVIAAMQEARSKGFDHIALTGGEPSVRPDFLQLIEQARRIGFSRITITTNGRMFAYREFARLAVVSGLTGASISLHGPDAATHEAMTSTPGSFAQTLAGLKNLRCERGPDGRMLELSTITVISRPNAHRLRETLSLAGSIGIGLHLVQPFIASRENLDIAPNYLLDRNEVRDHLIKALTGGLPHKGRVKPFNIAPCLLEGLEDVIEWQSYRVKTRREHTSSLVPKQFEFEDTCAACRFACPGHRVDLVPDEEAARHIVEDLRASAIKAPDVTLCGTDMLRPKGLLEVLLHARDIARGWLRVVHGGISISSCKDVIEACRASRVDELCLFVMPPTLRWPDKKAWMRGNIRHVQELLTLTKGNPRPSLLLMPAMAFSNDCDMDVTTVLGLCELLKSSGGSEVYMFAPDRLDAEAEPLDDCTRNTFLSSLPDLVRRIREIGCNPILVKSRGSSLEQRLLGLLPISEWAFALHRYARTELGFLLWSYPHALLNPVAG